MVTTKKINKRYRKGNEEGIKMVHQKKNPSNTKEGSFGATEEQKGYDIQKTNSTMAEKIVHYQ